MTPQLGMTAHFDPGRPTRFTPRRRERAETKRSRLYSAAMTTHELKSWPGQFQAMWTGLKRAEYRRDDRGYCVGDLLELREWDPGPRWYTGFRLTARVTHLVRGPELDVPEGYVVLSIEVLGARVSDSGPPPG